MIGPLIMNAPELFAVITNVKAGRLPRNRTQLEDHRPNVEEPLLQGHGDQFNWCVRRP